MPVRRAHHWQNQERVSSVRKICMAIVWQLYKGLGVQVHNLTSLGRWNDAIRITQNTNNSSNNSDINKNNHDINKYTSTGMGTILSGGLFR